MIERFVSRRLITVDDSSVEISHEALLVAWPRLADWVASDHEGLRLHRRLTGATYAWQEADFDDHLLLRGTQLTATEEWFADPDHRADLNRLERDFIQSSVAARTLALRTERRRTVTLRTIVAALAVLLVWPRHDGLRAACDQRRRPPATCGQHRTRRSAVERDLDRVAARVDDRPRARRAARPCRAADQPDRRRTIGPARRAVRRRVSRLIGPSGPTAMARNPAGTIEAISNAATGTVALHKIVDGRPGRTLSVIPAGTNSSQIFAIAFDHDGDELALGGLGGTVRLVGLANVDKPTVEATAPGTLGPGVQALAFTRSDSQLYAAGGAPGIRAWAIRNPDDPTPLPRPDGLAPTATVQSLAFGPGARPDRRHGGRTVLIWPLTCARQKPRGPQARTIGDRLRRGAADGIGRLVGAKDASVTALDLAMPTEAPRRVEGVHRLHVVGQCRCVQSGRRSGRHRQRRRQDRHSPQRGSGHASGRSPTRARSRRWTMTEPETSSPRRPPTVSSDRFRSAETRHRNSAGPRSPSVSRLRAHAFHRHDGVRRRRRDVAANPARHRCAARYLPLPTTFGHPDGTGAIAPDARVVASGNASGQVVTDTLDGSGDFDGQPQVLARRGHDARVGGDQP